MPAQGMQQIRVLPSPLDLSKMDRIMSELDVGQRACVRSCLQCWQVSSPCCVTFVPTAPCRDDPPWRDGVCLLVCSDLGVPWQDGRLDEEELIMQMKTLTAQSPTLAGMFRKSDIMVSRMTEVASSDDMTELMALFGNASVSDWTSGAPRHKSVSPVRAPAPEATIVRRTPSCVVGVPGTPASRMAGPPGRGKFKISSGDFDQLLSGAIDVAAHGRAALQGGGGIFSTSCPTLPVSSVAAQPEERSPLGSPKRRRCSPTRHECSPTRDDCPRNEAGRLESSFTVSAQARPESAY
jgi:hypothetical protein